METRRTRSTGPLALLALSVSLAAATPALARTQTPEYTETADLNSLGDLGDSDAKLAVALDGEVLALRMFVQGDYVVRVLSCFDGIWGVTDDLPDPEPSSISAFGAHLSLSANTLAIGHASVGSGAGTVYVHVRDALGEWSLEQALTASDATRNAGFSAAEIDGDRILVGAAFESTQVQQGGAAYVFERTGGVWTETAKLQPSAPIVGDRLGREVALHGDLAVLNSESGATVFRNVLGVWSEEAKLTHTAPIGRSVSTDGTTIGLAESGSTRAILFEQVAGSWTSVGQISTSPSFPRPCRVVVEEGKVLISSTLVDLSAVPSAIGTWLAERTTAGWPTTASPLQTRPKPSVVPSPDPSVDRVAARGGRIASLMIRRESGSLGQRGTVILHEPVSTPPVEFCFGSAAAAGCVTCPCGNDSPEAEFAGCLSASGGAPRLFVGGVPRVSEDTLRFELRYAQPVSFALLVSGDQRLPAQGPCPPGSGILGMPALDGLRCVGMNLIRHGTRTLNNHGATPTPWGSAQPAQPQGLIDQGAFSAGQTRHWQSFFRQPPGTVCTAGIGTSQGISVTFAP